MKKSLINKLYKYSAFTLFASVFALSLSSCNIGLGEAVDLTAPSVSITSHQDNDSVGTTFKLFGTAEDNEKIARLAIDFDDADIHYQVTAGGSWQKKTSRSNGWQTITSDANNYCTQSEGRWSWSIDVDTSEKIASKTGSTYNLLAVVEDERGNSGKNSKAERSLIVDTQSPKVSVYKPELFDNYGDLNTNVNANRYRTEDGNVISRLLNGTVQLHGRQEDALSFKALRIEFDNGITSGRKTTASSSTAVSSIEEVLALGDSVLGDTRPASRTYFSRTLTGTELREWSITVNPDEWASSTAGIANGLNTGASNGTKPHIIRVVTTSLSTSYSWERSVLGYFLWYPEADRPWITLAIGDDPNANGTDPDTINTECYPKSNISGQVQDDDGIASFESILYKKSTTSGSYEVSKRQTHTLPRTNSGDSPKYAAWTVEAPSSNGFYKLVLKVRDIYGAENTLTKYFKTSDVSAPKIEITAPANGALAISNVDGNITFTGTVTDDGEIESVEMVWLNPAKRNDTANKIKYLNASNTSWNAVWDETTGNGFKHNEVTQDIDGNKLFKFNVPANSNSYTISKTFNLFTDFGIDGNTKQLVAQEFIFRAYDGHAPSVKAVTLTGDTTAPDIALKTITIGSTRESIENNAPTYPASANGKKAVITGTWSDNFATGIPNGTKVKTIAITWGSGTNAKTATATPLPDKTWTSSEIDVPDGGGTITATITDFGGNIKTVQGAVRVETNELGLARIGCLNDDGAYNTGKEIYLTLEFTKNTNINTTKGSPTLTLNNGGIAYFVPGAFTIGTTSYNTGYGNGTPIHVFKYTVGTTCDVDKLSVSSINANGAKWIDTATANSEHPYDITSKVIIATPSSDSGLQASSNLAATRSIKIDTTAPRVKSVTSLSSTGYYNGGKDILIWMEFKEDVEITGISADALKVNFSAPSERYANNPTVSGSKYVLLTYTVNPATNTEGTNGDNANPLAFSSITAADGVTVKDKAGNSLTDWTPENTTSFAGIIIDTTKPNPPAFKTEHGGTTTWDPARIIFDTNGTKFGLSGEDGATLEYTTDGTNWLPYNKETIELSNDKTYLVKARQTDRAGNRSDESAEKTFTIDKGELFTRITADTVSGVYSANTAIKKIVGRIEFRKTVKIAMGATVTLNVKRGTSNTLEVPIIQCASGAVEAGEASVFTFEYTILEGDSIDTTNLAQTDAKYGLLDVKDWSFDTIQFADPDENGNGNYLTYTITKPSNSAFANAKRLNSNREIKVLTGLPTVITDGIVLDETSGTKIKVTFDREIIKVNGNITITQDLAGYHVPAVLTVDEYNEYCGKIQSVMEANYYKGTNGASASLVNDTATKYILNFNKDDTDADLVKAFTVDQTNPNAVTAKSHIVTIPIVADDVYTVNASGQKSDKGYTLVIDLNDTYKLPVKGAKYSLNIPIGAVTDEVQNKNDTAITKTNMQTSGVEAPVIRMLKPSYTISGAGNTKNASADMTAAQSAQIRIDCRTPDATIKYNTNIQESVAVTINSKTVTSSEGAKPTVPAASNTYNPASATDKIISLASADSYKVDSYDNAKGLKIAVIATATANGTTKTAYEYATRSVLKFHINNYDDHDYAKGSNTAPGNGLKFKDLKVWVTGGDATYGGNSLDPFPLSWAIPGNFKLMNGSLSGDNQMSGDFYWVSWDITTKTFHGFVIGDVPSDAATNGPSVWFSSECSWVTLKNNYPLYPGETLIMDTADVSPYFAFRDKNKGSR